MYRLLSVAASFCWAHSRGLKPDPGNVSVSFSVCRLSFFLSRRCLGQRVLETDLRPQSRNISSDGTMVFSCIRRRLSYSRLRSLHSRLPSPPSVLLFCFAVPVCRWSPTSLSLAVSLTLYTSTPPSPTPSCVHVGSAGHPLPSRVWRDLLQPRLPAEVLGVGRALCSLPRACGR